MKFHRLGISFQYPDNWTLDDQDAIEGRRSVTVYSPGGAFWTVTIHPHSAEPTRLAEAAVEAMKAEYEEVEAEEVRETLADHDLTGFDMNFFYLDLTNSARILALRTKAHTYTVFCQGEDREYVRVAAVFQAMTTSLLQGIK